MGNLKNCCEIAESFNAYFVNFKFPIIVNKQDCESFLTNNFGGK